MPEASRSCVAAILCNTHQEVKARRVGNRFPGNPLRTPPALARPPTLIPAAHTSKIMLRVPSCTAPRNSAQAAAAADQTPFTCVPRHQHPLHPHQLVQRGVGGVGSAEGSSASNKAASGCRAKRSQLRRQVAWIRKLGQPVGIGGAREPTRGRPGVRESPAAAARKESGAGRLL